MTNAFAKYFETYDIYDREQTIWRLMAQQIRSRCMARPKYLWLRPFEHAALKELIAALYGVLEDIKEDIKDGTEPYLSEKSCRRFGVLVKECNQAMEKGDAALCYDIVGQLHDEIMEGISAQSSTYKRKIQMMDTIHDMLEKGRPGQLLRD